MPPQWTILRRALTALVLCAVHTSAFRSPAPRLGRIKNRAATQWDARRAGSARTDLTVAKVLAGPASEEDVAHAVEALLQPGGKAICAELDRCLGAETTQSGVAATSRPHSKILARQRARRARGRRGAADASDAAAAV